MQCCFSNVSRMEMAWCWIRVRNHSDNSAALEEGFLPRRILESEKYRLIVEYGIASYDNMREWIFSFGDRVRILEPESLRADRIRQARNLLKVEDENES